MASMTLNQLIEILRGKLGHLVFRQRPDGKVIVSSTPHYRKGKASQKQKDHRQKFGTNARQAKLLARQYPIYAELAHTENARGAWKSAYNFALSDCLHPPVIHRVERGEGCIRVEATDNIMVVNVSVTVFDEQDQVVEVGDALHREGDWWEFASSAQSGKIRARAWDLARNMTEFIVE